MALFVFGFVGFLVLLDRSRTMGRYVPKLAFLGLVGFVCFLKAADHPVPDTHDDTMVIVEDGKVRIESLKEMASKRNPDAWLRSGAWSKDNQ